MCMQNFITIFHSVQEIGPFALFQDSELGKDSTNDKCHFAISLARSCQYQCVYKNFITIFFHSVQEIGPFSLFQNLELGKASTNDKCHFAISWASSCQYQCICRSLSKYSERFTSYQHFSLTVRGAKSSQTHRSQNLHKLPSGDKIFTKASVTKSNV